MSARKRSCSVLCSTVHSPVPRDAASSESGDDRVAPELRDAVDPLVGVDLEHLLGRVLRAVEALPLEHAQLLHGGAGRDERERQGHARGERDDDEPDLRQEHAVFAFLTPPRPSRSARRP